MANLSAFLADPREIIKPGEPGSNGFARREVYARPGTYTFVAKKTGRVKIQALGAGAGSQNDQPGASGAFGEKELSVTAGQTLTIVVGSGSVSTGAGATATADAGTTSVSGTPVGATPLTLVGAKGGTTLANTVPGVGTGPWDLTNPGARASGVGNRGGTSSGSPFGPGIASSGRGGSGWGGSGGTYGGGGTHSPGDGPIGGTGLESRPSIQGNPETRPAWDMRDADAAGGSGGSQTSDIGTPGGYGSGGGGADNNVGGPATVGGGGGNGSRSKGSAGSGSGCPSNGAKGGDGLVYVFWDEVF